MDIRSWNGFNPLVLATTSFAVVVVYLFWRKMLGNTQNKRRNSPCDVREQSIEVKVKKFEQVFFCLIRRTSTLNNLNRCGFEF